MICFSNPGLTSGLLYSANASIFNNMLYVCDKVKHILKRQTHPLVSEDVDRKDVVKKRTCGRAPQEAWRQDELVGGKLPDAN
jgi:hypothetical protein